MEKGISVIICCYDSANTITDTLMHLKKQQTNTLKAWELLIIDNRCTDNTIDIVKTVWPSGGNTVPMRIIREDQAGLTYARRCGVMAARYSYTVFCDDDNFLQSDYLEIAYRVMEGNPKIGVLGGMSTAYFTTTPPSWFDKVKDGYAIGKQFTRQGDITEERGYIWGAGMVMPTLLIRSIFNSVFTSSDRKGAILASGGDTEICYKAIAAGYRLYYDERLQYRHYITEDRMNWNYKVRLAEGQTKSLVNLLYLRKRILNNITETKQVVLKDFSYIIFHNIKWKYLVRISKILNIRKHEGDVDLLHAYLDLYFIYCFFQIKILCKN